MNNLRNMLILSSALTIMSFTVNAQAFENVKTAIKMGSGKGLANYFDNNIEITVDGKTANYSRAQGEFVVKDFFKKNPATGFKIIHNGTSGEGGLKYAIGTYSSSSGGSFRVLIRMKQSKVYNLSFTKE